MACEAEKDEFGLCADPDCFPCKCKSINLSSAATPTRAAARPPGAPPRGNSNSWEKGVPTDGRGMPVLRRDGTPMGQQEFSENRSRIEEHRKMLAQAPAQPS